MEATRRERRVRFAPLWLGMAALLSAMPGVALAQDLPVLAIDMARPLPDPQQSVLSLDRRGTTLPLWSPRFALMFMGSHQPLRYDEPGAGTRLRVDSLLVMGVSAAVGLGPADIGLALPVHLAVSGAADGVPLQPTTIGDMVLVPRVALLNGQRGPASLLLSVAATLPTGQERQYAGRMGFSAEPRLQLTLHPGRFRVAVRPGLVLQSQPDLATSPLSHWLTLRAAVGIAIDPAEAVRAEIGMDGILPVGDKDLTSADLLAGAAVEPVEGLVITAHGGVGVGALPGIARGRVLIGVGWTFGGGNGGRDLDMDGISDRRDKCPEAAEDRDSNEDEDGCPDPDNDGDGVLDTSDACPEQAGKDESGCPPTGVIRDLDGDDIVEEDACPLQPEDVDGFEDRDGCPESDNDGDLIPDSQDLCPNVPEDGDPPSPRDGCPVG